MAGPNAGAKLFAGVSGNTPTPTTPTAHLSPGAALFHGTAPAPPAKPEPTHHGLLGSIEHAASAAGHAVAGKLELAGHDLLSTPGGLLDLVKAEGHSIGQTIHHPLISPSKFKETYQHPLRPVAGTAQTPELAKVVGQGFVKGSVEAIRHPLRDPFQTLLTVLPATKILGGAALRAGAATDAVKAGEGATAAVKAAARKPEVKPRLIRQGDTQTPLQPSKNPGVRAGQALYDKVIQHALDTKPEGKIAAHAEKRIGASLDETARYQQRMREAPAAALDKAAKKLTSRTSRGEKRVNQAALELTSVNTTAEAAAKYHLGQAEKGVDPARNRVVAKLYQTVHERGLLTTNEAGDVIVNAADHPRLAVTDVRLARAQGIGDQTLAKYGVRSEDALREAVNAPGKYRAGATYETPTPGKHGVSPALDRATSRRDRLQTAFDKLYEKGVARYQTVTRPRTIDEARTRLAHLEDEHNKALDQIAAAKFGPIDRAEVARRNVNNARALRQQAGVTRAGRPSGASGRKYEVRPTVTAERRALVTNDVENAIARNPDHPTLKRWADRANEIDQLRAALNPDIGEAIDKTQLGANETIRYKGRSPKLERTGGALSIANDEVQRLERARDNRITETGVVGGESARPGRGHVSYASSEKQAPKSAAAASPGPVVGETRPPITSHANTGANISKGIVPDDITGQAARKLRSILRFKNTTERRNAAIRTGSDVRRSSRDVLVAVPGEEHAKIPQIVEETLGRKKPTADQIDGLNAALDAYRHSLVPGLGDSFAADVNAPLGQTAADAATERGLEAPGGYKWVSRHALGELANPKVNMPRGRIAKTFDNLNTSVTAATVYFKLGHIGTRILTNTATNIIQGSADPFEVRSSIETWKALSDEDKARALAAAGQHSFSALPTAEGTGPVSRFVSGIGRAGANWWAKHADAAFRANSILYEARKAGFDTPAKFRDLLDKLEDPSAHNMSAAETAKVDWVAKRANREGIAYDRLSNFERTYITRALWFYPWTAGATRFAVNTALEHPFKAATLGTLAVQGRKTQAAELGDLPSYEQGLVKLGGSESNPLVTDFSTFSPLATPGQLLQVPSVGTATGYLNPAYGALLQLALRQNQYGQHTNNPVGSALSSLFQPTPEAQALSAYLHPPKPTQMFQKTWQSALARAAAGPALPRKINLSAAHKAAARERSGR